MICELCGRDAVRGFNVKLEGSLVTACENCARLGEVVAEVKPPKPKKEKAPPAETPKPDLKVGVEYELIEGFGSKIKSARERTGLTQEELGKSVNEAESVIHRMELGKFEPPVDVVRKLEHKLGVRLLTVQEDGESTAKPAESKELTVGDMVVVRKRGR